MVIPTAEETAQVIVPRARLSKVLQIRKMDTGLLSLWKRLWYVPGFSFATEDQIIHVYFSAAHDPMLLYWMPTGKTSSGG